MEKIEQEVFAVDVVKVDVVAVGPIRGPRIDQGEVIAAILNRLLVIDDDRPTDFEGVLTTKTGAELVVRDVRTLPGGTRMLCLPVHLAT